MDPRTPFDYCAIKPCCEPLPAPLQSWGEVPSHPLVWFWSPQGAWILPRYHPLLSLCSWQHGALYPGERRWGPIGARWVPRGGCQRHGTG